MVLKLRLARISTPGGAKRHHPRYNIVLAHARTARDSLPLEVLGTYNPIPSTPAGVTEEDVRAGRARKVKEIKVDVSRAKYWLGVGAQPSDTVWRVLSMTEKALKAVRFPTHLPAAPASASTTANASAETQGSRTTPA
ncbi:hypothetical protein B0A54_06748 [Friedmanniomyces endolithicus]|uniref:Ribosomal protein S16, mitochondrial n=1 Tax=Friedmanniomyces endolithicus TaxID=329885 RepID=A0A4U0V0U1_9PEZI|nr:hypothetical protein B0A54_06748 [Friedmanniomyces endolithicus]